MINETSTSEAFGYQIKAELYQKARPNYPDEFYRLIKEQHPTQNYRVCLDVGTGTGQIAGILHEQFDKVYALDISESQLKIAKEIHQDKGNVSFHYKCVYELEAFVQEHNIEGQVDLIIIGIAFHWFEDKPKALAIISRILKKSKGLLCIWGYTFNYNDLQPITDYEDRKRFFDIHMEDSVTKDIRGSHILKNLNDIAIDATFKMRKNFEHVINDLDCLYTNYMVDQLYFEKLTGIVSSKAYGQNAAQVKSLLSSYIVYNDLMKREGIKYGDNERDPMQIMGNQMIQAYKEFLNKKEDVDASTDDLSLDQIPFQFPLVFFGHYMKCKE